MKLAQSLARLRRLRLLSLRLTLTSLADIRLALDNHYEHKGKLATFMHCSLCFKDYESAAQAREIKVSERLAEGLPNLKHVRWLNIYEESKGLDEGAQKQYTIERLIGGKVRASLDDKYPATVSLLTASNKLPS